MKILLSLMLSIFMATSLLAMDDQDSRILYWRGYVNANIELINNEDVEETVNKIVLGEYQAVNLEKLHGHSIYSARINKSDRLLFTTTKDHNGSHMVLLDVVRNHDYHKSKFLKTNVLSNFLEKNAQEISQAIRSRHFDACDTPDSVAALKRKTAKYKLVPADYHNDKFIIFNIDQEQALVASLPAIVSGSPGSGKSAVALSMLCQLGKQHHIDDPSLLPFLYVANSKPLVDQMQAMWASLPNQDIPDDMVQFKTYNEILLDLYNLNENDLVDEAYFNTWLEEYITQNRKKTVNRLFKQKDIFYQEFRIISGFNEAEEYKDCGQRNASIKKEDREVMFELYQEYQHHLHSRNMIDPTFFAFDLHKHYSFIVVDESQDLSRRQLLNLRNLVVNRQIAYCIDTHQSLLDTKSVRPFLKSIDNDITFISLPSSYRCPSSVINLANAVINQKMALTGGLVDKEEYPEIKLNEYQEKNDGEVVWIDEKSQDYLDTIQQQFAQTTDFAIVTHQEFIAEAKQKFNTPLVFTPEEVKGLEYTTILAYKLFNDDVFSQANTILKKKSGDTTKKTNRPKTKGDFDDSFGPLYNQIFTAFTRATTRLLIYQEQERSIQHVLQPLITITDSGESGIILVTAEESPATPDQWHQQMDQLIAQGKLKQARDIYTHKLNLPAEDFDRYVSERQKKPEYATRGTAEQSTCYYFKDRSAC